MKKQLMGLANLIPDAAPDKLKALRHHLVNFSKDLLPFKSFKTVKERTKLLNTIVWIKKCPQSLLGKILLALNGGEGMKRRS